MSASILITILFLSKVMSESVDLLNITEVLIPTSEAVNNEKCRNHSALYLQELKKFTLWAVEMFDASAKFPSGVIIGSTHNMGNYDECLQIEVALKDDKFTGRYCLAKLNIEPKENDYYNVSVWDEILKLSTDPSKRPRNEIYWGFCIPSSCKPLDLENHLEHVAVYYSYTYNISISVHIGDRSCQTANSRILNNGDILFICILLLFGAIVLASTVYSLIILTQRFEKSRIQGIGHDIILSFSLYANLKKLMELKNHKDNFDGIHGLKVITMALVIIGHRIMFLLGNPITNAYHIEQYYEKIETMLLLNGPIIVNTFFNLSGFLVSYLMLKELDNHKSLNFLVLYIHRILRLLPMYAIVLAFYSTVFVKMGSGPSWEEKVGIEHDRCRSNWWTNVLFINNYLNTDNMCMFQSWYIASDFHLFIIAPFVVYALWKYQKWGIVLSVLTIALGLIASFYMAYVGKFDGLLLLFMKTLKDPVLDRYFNTMYVASYTRISPYITGILAGFIRHKIQTNNTTISRNIVWSCWIITTVVMNTTLYTAYVFYTPHTYNAISSALYTSLHHFTWSLGISWIAIALTTKNAVLVDFIFSWKPYVILSRLIYAAFLVHGGHQLYTSGSNRVPYYVSIYYLVWYGLGDVAMSFIFGLILSVMFESPIINIEKLIFKKHEKQKPVTSESQESEPPVYLPVLNGTGTSKLV